MTDLTFEQLKTALGLDDSSETANVKRDGASLVITDVQCDGNWVTLSNHGFGGIYIGSADGKEVWNGRCMGYSYYLSIAGA